MKAEPTPAGAAHGAVRVLEHDPDLAEGLSPEAREEATAAAVAAVMPLQPGDRPAPQQPEKPGFGLLVIEGLLMRDVLLGTRVGSELVGIGDVLQPWEEDPAAESLPLRSRWRVLTETRVALLDRGFLLRIARWPEISEVLVRRMIRRSRALSSLLLISRLPRVEARLLVFLSYLADRWGTVTPEGVVVPIKMTHEVIGTLVGCKRPTVTTGLAVLSEAGIVQRTEDGWLLAHDPLSHLERFGGSEAHAATLVP